jgi:hypothetical protein
VDGFLEPVRRDLFGRAIGRHALGERSAAAQGVVQLAVGLQVPLGIALGDVHVEIGLDLVDEADVLARELPACTGQRPQMARDVVAARRIEVVRNLGQQTLGLDGQVGRIGRGLVLHLAAQVRVACVGVDVAFLDPVEAQTDQQIFAD